MEFLYPKSINNLAEDRAMKAGLTEIVFILDKSGSMSGLEKDTIGGYNSFIEKQKKVEGEALVSTVLFSDQNEVIHDRVPISKIEPMNDAQYSVGGCTALLDAIGGAIHHIGNVHKYAREEDVPEKTIFVIIDMGTTSHISNVFDIEAPVLLLSHVVLYLTTSKI